MNDTTLFAFEHDFVETLRCIPMAVRFKLDLCGVKVSLRQWSRFSQPERRALLLLDCDDPREIEAYRAVVAGLIEARDAGEAKPLPEGSCVPWDQVDQTPLAVIAFAGSVNVEAPSDSAWRRLTPLQRFVLLKLSRDNHDNVNFVPALAEFGLHGGPPALLARAS